MTRLFWMPLLAAFLLWPFVRWDLPPYRFDASRAVVVRAEMSVEAFRLDCGRLPHSLDELLGAWSGPPCGPDPWSRLGDLRDPFGNKIHYWTSGDGLRYELRAVGRDRVYGSADDVVCGDWDWPWKPAPVIWTGLRDFLLFPALLLTAFASGAYLLCRGLWRWWHNVVHALPGQDSVLRSVLRRTFAMFWIFALIALLDRPGCPRQHEVTAEAQLSLVAVELEDLRRRCGSLPFALDQPPLPLVCGPDAPTRASQRIDPWGSPITYARQPFNPGYVLYSTGADRVNGTADDIVHGDARRPWLRSYHDPWLELDALHGFAGIALLMFLTEALTIAGFAAWHRRGGGGTVA
jgi:Type II secretion system (T2SS), protein G